MSSVRDGDLRSEAKDQRRVKTYRTKWSRGALPAPGKQCHHNPSWYNDGKLTCSDCAKRPVIPQRSVPTELPWLTRRGYTKHTISRKSNRQDADQALDEYSDGSSADDYARPVHDDYMYSFDAQRGPGEGSQVLSHAIVQAVERFENKETEKIVREYDLVIDSDDDVHFAHTDDDFELVESARL